MKEAIVNVLKKALESKKLDISEAEIEKHLEIPPSVDMGDYAFPCFFLAEKLRDDPHQIALDIREKIGNISPDFEDIQAVGPYINFFLNRNALSLSILKEILSKKEKYGSLNIGKGEKALIEHTSINPNASPHVGRARNAIIGDSIVKILDFVNFKPETHYFVNDVSKQTAMLVLAKAEKLDFQKMLKAYIEISKKVESSKQTEQDVFVLLRRFEGEDAPIVKKFKKIVGTCVKGQKDILSRLGIKYDFFDYESSYLKKSKKLIETLKKTNKIHKDKEGRLYLDQKSTTLRKSMKSAVLVLTRSDETGLYPLRDMAYTIDKMKIAEKNIVVLGEDQKLYFNQLKEALKVLGYNAPEVVHYSFVLLKERGKSKKMSTRKGDVVLLETFLSDVTKKAEKEIKKRKTKGDANLVAVGAVKYRILKTSPSKTINFDLDEALQFEGDTGPYLLYSYARASSILKKAKNKKARPSLAGLKKEEVLKISKLEDKELELLTKLSQFPEVVLNAYKNLNPSLIANYSYQLAQIFNEFYHSCPVIGSEQEAFRLSLVEAFRHVMKTSLSLLGIKTLEVM